MTIAGEEFLYQVKKIVKIWYPAKAIVDYTSQITITAMIPGSPPVTVTGPPA